MSSNLTDRINGVLSSLAAKAPCLYATTANITLSGLGTRAGGTWASALTAGNRILVMNQTDATENGIYDADSSDWSRSKDFDGNRDVVQGTRVAVVNNGNVYELTTANPITIGTSSITLNNTSLVSYGRTDAETAAGVTPTNYYYPAGHVFRYGADRTGVADSYQAIQNAINVIAQTGYGGEVIVPWGDYKISTGLSLPNLVRLLGEGMDATNLRYTGSGTAVAIVGTSPSPVVKAGVKNLSIYGNASSLYGLNLQYAVDCFFEDLRIYNHNIGVYLYWSYDNVFNFIKGEACYQDGWYYDDEANANAMTKCSGTLNGRAGLYMQGGRGVQSLDCTWEANDDYGVYLLGDQDAIYRPKSLSISGGYIEGNGLIEVFIDKSALADAPLGIDIKGVYFCALTGKATQAIRAQDVDGLNVDGCTFDDQGVPYAYSLYVPAGGTLEKIVWGFNTDRSTGGVYREVFAHDLPKATAKATAQFLGKTTVTVNTSYGVTSVVRNSAGAYTVTIQKAMPSVDFPVLVTAEDGSLATPPLIANAISTSATTFDINVYNIAGTPTDGRTISFAVF